MTEAAQLVGIKEGTRTQVAAVPAVCSLIHKTVPVAGLLAGHRTSTVQSQIFSLSLKPLPRYVFLLKTSHSTGYPSMKSENRLDSVLLSSKCNQQKAFGMEII